MITWFKNLFARLLGKEVNGEVVRSNAKTIAIVYVLVTAVQELSKAWGHPIVIPEMVFKFLEGAGLWTIRDAIKS